MHIRWNMYIYIYICLFIFIDTYSKYIVPIWAGLEVPFKAALLFEEDTLIQCHTIFHPMNFPKRKNIQVSKKQLKARCLKSFNFPTINSYKTVEND